MAADQFTPAGLRVVAAEPSEADVGRAARAICGSIDGLGPWEYLSERGRYDFRREARAALAAFLRGGDDASDV